jgi:SOS-response transcriptional repressor LexA
MPILPRISKLVYRARKRLGFKQESLGQLVGCSGSYITKIEKGCSAPSAGMAVKLEKTLRLKKGTLLNSVLQLKQRETNLKRQAILKARFGGGKEAGSGFDDARFARVPLLVPVSVCALDLKEEPKRYFPIPKEQVSGLSAYLLRVPDDCLDQEGLHEGDLLLVEDRPPKDGELCVYCDGPDYFIRRCRLMRDGVSLEPNSSNAAHKPSVFRSRRDVVWKGVVKAIYLKQITRGEVGLN